MDSMTTLVGMIDGVISWFANSATLHGVAGGVVSWFVTNFLTKSILAVREKRREAIQVADRYWEIGFGHSDELRTAAVRSLNDVATALRAYGRESQITRAWCRLMRYDLELAARCLMGLAAGAAGENLREETRRNNLNAIYVSLGATSHLTKAEIDFVKRKLAAVTSGAGGEL
jgi:hypothetical protein